MDNETLFHILPSKEVYNDDYFVLFYAKHHVFCKQTKKHLCLLYETDSLG